MKNKIVWSWFASSFATFGNFQISFLSKHDGGDYIFVCCLL